MSIKGACPNCGTGGDISFFIADADARKATLAAAKLPSDCGIAVIKYISMFSPANRFLTPGRYSKLISECCDMIIDGVAFNRDHVKAPSYVWRQAMMEMDENQKIQRPIKNHHYLLCVVQSVLNKRNDANQSERADHRRTHEPSRVRSGGMKPAAEALEETVLPELPRNGANIWLARAEAKLKDDYGLKSGAFMSGMMIQNMARELYADSLK